MTISPHHVAGVFLATGLATGGYFAVRAVTPPTLEEQIKSLNLDLETNWATKAASYKTEQPNLIEKVKKEGDASVVEQELKNWCQKKKDKPFHGNTDFTYKNFSIWCTVNKRIKDALSKRGLKGLNEEGWTSKFSFYGELKETDKFVEPKKDTTLVHLQTWCKEKQEGNYTYEGDDTLIKIISWCYAS